MTAFDKAWNLTKYSFDSRGEPNKVMSPSGRMRTGGNLPGPETLNEHLSDRDQNEHRLKESIMIVNSTLMIVPSKIPLRIRGRNPLAGRNMKILSRDSLRRWE